MSEKTVPTLKLGDIVIVGESCFRLVIDILHPSSRSMVLAEYGDAEDAEALARNAREFEAILLAAVNRNSKKFAPNRQV